MAFSKFDTIFNLTSEHAFVVDGPLDEGLMCVICKKLLTNAFHNNDCDCSYCYKCIIEYINNEQKLCPGSKEFCKEEFIVIDKNVVKSLVLDRKISRLKVCCPNKSCDCKLELNNMNDHLRVCIRQPIECPFVHIGCNIEPQIKNVVESHLQNDQLNHTELLMDFVRHLKNEICQTQEGFEKSKLENAVIQNNLRNEIESLRKYNDDLTITKNEMEIRMNKEMEELKTTMKNLDEKNICEIRSLKRERDKEMIETDAAIDHIKRQLYVFYEEMHQMRDDKKKFDDTIVKRMDNLIKSNMLYLSTDFNFIWKIEECSTKINKELYSDEFYCQDYKWCLFLRIYEDDTVGLWCHIMKGDHDDKLRWPMRHKVTLSIINQHTMKVHMQDTYQYDTYQGGKHAFNRPTNDINDWFIGSASFINYSSIKDNRSILANDTIVVLYEIADP